MKKLTLLLLILATGAMLTLSGCGGDGGGPASPAAAGDLDGDGVPDAADAFPNDPVASVDTDGDGFPDAFNPGATSAQRAASPLTPDAFPDDPAISRDSDGDGHPDDYNPNATPDQIAACTRSLDRFPADRNEWADFDGDGIGDNGDHDDDNDGVADGQDAFPWDRSETKDFDGDGIGNNADPDDDNDGIPDAQDAFPFDADEFADNDGDGIGNGADPDDDNDGIPDALDAFPVNPQEWEDSDGDGVGDNADTDDDNDGVPDTRDAFPRNPAETLDTDGDGIGNNADPDDDNDGVADAADAFPLDPTETADKDGDGVGDNREAAVRAAARAVGLASLAGVVVPEPPNLGEFLNPGEAARTAAIQLGKALFWDMQVGSDGQACGSCHFNAGADTRTRNQLSPHLRLPTQPAAFDATASGGAGGPHYELTRADFPFHRLADPELENFNARVVLFDTDDVAASQGVFQAQFGGNVPEEPFDLGTPVADGIFNLAGVNTRRVEPRNTPTMINAVFNFTNFWDGRAHPHFNGETVIGPLDDTAGVWVESGGVLTKVAVEIPNASLASQAVGPPLSTDEMSFIGRTFPDLGRKLLGLEPLALQEVHPGDSILGHLLDPVDGRGLAVSYTELIQTVFRPAYWNSTQPVALPEGEFTQMEANFALFFGLAVQMYEATLVSAQTPFDRFMEGDDSGLGPEELTGLKVFMNIGDPTQLPGGAFADLFAGVSRGLCSGCHSGPELTAHSVAIAGGIPTEIDFVAQLVNGLLVPDLTRFSYLDEGFYNIGVRPTAEDLGRGRMENGIPLSFTHQAIAGLDLPFATLPADNPEFPGQLPVNNRASTKGAFKVPGLRNVELTGPYFHNGGQATLEEVVEFYDRHGDFSHVNLAELDGLLAQVQLTEDDEDPLVAFMLALTDDRVRFERAPFDHPQLFIPAGDGLQVLPQPPLGSAAEESFIELPAVGAAGRSLDNPLVPFLTDTDRDGVADIQDAYPRNPAR